MKKYAIIVAGGEGTRMGGALPKQFHDLCGAPVIVWSMRAFRKEDPLTELILVINPRFKNSWDETFNSLKDADDLAHIVVGGGSSRTESVKNGLMVVPDGEDVFVAVHDAARPLVSPEIISRGWQTAVISGCAVPCVPVTDSLRILEENNNHAVDRSKFVAIQTPQVFNADILKKAYLENPEKTFSDDATACEAVGVKTILFDGAHSNFKITNPGDIEYASIILNG